ncbi:MAG TPA: M1 family aminopeptidase [Blastocatellia bacterium]|nr:M1 family aminopeptidase [Blastocatellia bacterium]
MPIHDPLIHPALLDPRQWGEVNLYEPTISIEREPLGAPEQQAPDRHFDLTHLSLDLHFDDEQETASGTATVTLRPLADGFTHFELDAAELDVTAVRLITAGEKGAGESDEGQSSLAFETFQEKLAIELPRDYSRDETLTVEIAYSCRPRKGLYFIKPDDKYPEKPRQIWSQGQTEDAHWWFPCSDLPQQKMTTEMIATVRSNFFALSNGRLVSVTENAEQRTKTYHWRQDEPHPAYLVTVVVGEYERVQDHYDGLPVDYYVYRDQQAAGERLFARTPQMIEFFSRLYGHPYPYPKYAQILVSDFLFGAMENTSATTMTDRVLLDEQAAAELSYEDIVAHELAHHWWGDLVTCKHWSQIWLNESFATYSEYLWREYSCGEDEARFTLFQDFLTYLREDTSSHRRPIVHHGYFFSEELMDRHAYEKGACVLHMLRYALGDDGFFRSLAHYLNKFRFGVAETNDFKVAIEEATGKNLYWFFDQWIYKAGYPELEVGYEWTRDQKMLRLSVRQVQQEDKYTSVFRFPVEIEIAVAKQGSDEPERMSYRVDVGKVEQDFYFPCASKPRMVIFDKGHRVFKLMRFPKSAQELGFQLIHDEDVIGRMRAARELGAFKGDDTVNTLHAVVVGGDFPAVRMAAAISLGEIGTDGAREALIEAYRYAGNHPQVRRGIAWAMGNSRDESAVDFLREILEGDEAYFVSVAAVRALANIGSDKARDVIHSQLARSSWQEVIRASIFHGFAIAKDKRVVDLAIEHSRYGEHPAVRVAAIGCLGAAGKELHKDQADEKVVDHLIELLKDKAIRARVAAVKALGQVGNKRALKPLREAQYRECLDQLKSALRDAIRTLEAREKTAG